MKKWILRIGFGLLALSAIGALVVWYIYFKPPNHPAVGRAILGEAGPEPVPGSFDWPQFRGPQRDGKTPESNWSHEWTGSPRLLWSQDLGPGASGVSVSRGRLFTVANRESIDEILCLDAMSGRRLWTFEYTCSLSTRQFEGGPAATPTVDGDRAFVLSHEGQLFSLDVRTGERVWSLHVIHDLGGTRPFWGYATSPLVVGELLLVEPGGAGHAVAALEKATGKTRWFGGDDKAGYSSPVLFDHGGTPGVLVFHGTALGAYALADGRLLWRYPWETSYDVNAALPIPSGSKVFLVSGYGHGGALLEVSGSTPKLIWETTELRSQMGSSLLHAGHLYGIDDGGKLVCLDFETGTVRWEEKGFGKGTVILAGERLIILSEKGDLVIAAADSERYTEKSRAKVLGRRTWVSPTLANGILYAKDNLGRLVALDLRG